MRNKKKKDDELELARAFQYRTYVDSSTGIESSSHGPDVSERARKLRRDIIR